MLVISLTTALVMTTAAVLGGAGDGDVVDGGLVGACGVGRQSGAPDEQIPSRDRRADLERDGPASVRGLRDDRQIGQHRGVAGPQLQNAARRRAKEDPALARRTVRPMSSSSPVPACRPEKSALEYQSVCHAVLSLQSIASGASCGLSSWLVRPGPNAAELAGTSGTGAAAAEAACDEAAVLCFVVPRLSVPRAVPPTRAERSGPVGAVVFADEERDTSR